MAVTTAILAAPRALALMHSLPVVTRPMLVRKRFLLLPSALVKAPSSASRPCSPVSSASRGRSTWSNEVRQWSTGLPGRTGSGRTLMPGSVPVAVVSGTRKRKMP